ncbi:MAG: hypothetical protein QNI99_10215 [Woeseiaceae bacterium]|nr:hypothetical protein [Woeseiaceae bacterium]
MPRSAEILGVYPVEAPEPCRLIEMRVYGWDVEAFVDGTTQQDPSTVPDSWQVPWDERVLASDGGTVTLAFFFHYLNVSVPLTTPAGALAIPAPVELPERLSLIRYESP